MIDIYEAARKIEIKVPDKWIRRLHNIKHITLISKNDNLFISEEDYEKLKRNRLNNIPYDIEIPDGYLTRKEAAKEYEISYNALRQQEKNGTIDIVKSGGISLLKIDSLEKIKKYLEEVEFMEESDEWIKVADLHGRSDKYYKVLTTLKRNEFDNSQVRKSGYGKKEEKFINAKLYKEIIEGKYEITNYNNDLKNILPDDIKAILDKLIVNVGLNCNKQKAKMNNLVSLEDISIANKINVEDLLYAINQVDIEILINNEKRFIYEYDIEDLMHNYGYYSIKRLGKLTAIPNSTLKANLNIANKLREVEYFEIYNTLYLSLEAMEETLKEYSKKYISTLNLDEIQEERLKIFPSDLKETLELAKKFIKVKKNRYIKEYGEDTTNFTRLINAIEALIYNLEDEVFNCNSEYLLEIISNKKLIKTGYVDITCHFLNFVKRNLKSKCKFNKQFGKSIIDQFQIDNDGKVEDKIYDKETWAKYYLILKDTDKHIETAIGNFRYSQCWLYCILNLSVTWRKKNILLSLPRINLEEVGIYDLSWFTEEHIFTLEMAISVLEQIKFTLDGVIAYKNKRNLHFNIPLSLKIPTAIAFIICEIHCRKNQEKSLLYEINRAPLRKTDYKKIFNDDKLLDFQNLKCTRSIMSYGYSYSISALGGVPASYKIYSNSRSHSDSEQRMTNVTGDYYLILDNLEGGAKEYMYHIIERGAFGFMYYKLFQCILEEEGFNNITQDQMTQLTKCCKEVLNPMTLENIATNFIEYRNVNKLNVFEMLLHNSLNKNLNNSISVSKDKFLDKILEVYEEKARELFGDRKEFFKYISNKYKSIDDSMNNLSRSNFDMKNVLKMISDGSNCSFSQYTNCIFDRIERRELCPYGYGEKGGASCLGCKNNLLTIYGLYEISDRLEILLTKIEAKAYLSEEEIIKNSYLIKNYLSIIIEALVHFKEKELINNIINLKNIKKRIINAKNSNKILNF
ncbi:hypothetical protein [Clostridium cibarium]|uniref:Helix-turn-helix domain protein n=1 Tax=Clostridium cibarium TaxID=2762247 RepID=A0ABR8PYT0_9CLOT|nr:hypothetical protein [Clostridium cibarium]MBD7913317.1 hypothetical protein [Clostridium cibarium]